MEKITLGEVVTNYVESKASEIDDKVKEVLKDKISEDVKHDIISIYKDKIREEVIEQVNYERQLEKINTLKIMVVETLVIGFLVGLIVNQFTDIISFFKGSNGISMNRTFLAIAILGIIIWLVGKYLYLDKLNDFLKKIGNKRH